jgi:HTH-type transcriptional regulator/antitoxin HipB
MSFPIRITDQLTPHLRALRKARGLTQAQLGELVGVKQARIAEIEANPGTVSLEQLTRVLAALGATLHLHEAESGSRARAPVAPVPHGPASRTRVAREPVARSGVVIHPKKGSW